METDKTAKPKKGNPTLRFLGALFLPLLNAWRESKGNRAQITRDLSIAFTVAGAGLSMLGVDPAFLDHFRPADVPQGQITAGIQIPNAAPISPPPTPGPSTDAASPSTEALAAAGPAPFTDKSGFTWNWSPETRKWTKDGSQ